MAAKNIDDIFNELGFGRWQLPYLLLAVLAHLTHAVHLVGAPLLNAKVDFRCFSEVQTTTLSSFTAEEPGRYNITQEYDCQCAPSPLPSSYHVSNISFSSSSLNTFFQQSVQPQLHKTGFPSCPIVQYDRSTFFTTVVTEFDLICEQSGQTPLFHSLFTLGCMVGGVLGGWLSDGLGRRRTVLMAGSVQVVLVAAQASCFLYPAILLLRFIIGVCMSTCFFSTYNLAQETMPASLRTVSGMLVGCAFSLATIIFAGLGYLFRAWRPLLLTANCYMLVLLPLAWLVPESPRWLVQRDRVEEAGQVLQRAFTLNRSSLPPNLKTLVAQLGLSAPQPISCQPTQTEGSEDSTALMPPSSATTNSATSPAQLQHQGRQDTEGAGLRGRWCKVWPRIRSYLEPVGMRTILLVTPCIWFLQSMFYIGILLNANNFTNNPFIYLALSGLIDCLSILLATPLAIKFARRYLICSFLLCGGILYLLDMAVPPALWWLRWILVMLGLLLIAAALQLNFVYVPELFPTVIRGRGFGLVILAGNLGSTLASVITDVLGENAEWLVNAIFGVAGLVAAALVLLLPETRNGQLLSTVDEVEQRRLDAKNSSKRTTQVAI